MDIDLSELQGEPYRFEVGFEVTAAEMRDPVVSGPLSIHLAGMVRRLESGFEVKGRLTAEGSVACSRCTAAIPWSADETFDFELRSPEAAPLAEELELAAEELEVVFGDTETLDLHELAIQQVVLALPMKPLCSERCAGLCPRCGADLNAGEACRCGSADVDPRWAPLLALKDDPDRS